METIAIAGFPFSVTTNGNGEYVTAESQQFNLNGSPLILDIVPPVANISEISFPALVNALAAAIQSGYTYVGG
ncbi:MAG: hypothetical protein ACYDD1_04725 [Caulobacteraceae bacterium]